MRGPALIITSLTLLAGVLGCQARPAYRLSDHQVTVSHIAVIGDSYTTGSDEGGVGPQGWPARTGQLLDRDGKPVTMTVVAEGGAGYGVRGNRGSIFTDLANRAVGPDDTLVVFFGSRNDDVADLAALPGQVRDALAVARRGAPTARLLVIGPPWPTPEVPDAVLRVRDILAAEAAAVRADFVDPLAEGWFVGLPFLIGGDGIHPNDLGHAYLADRIAPLISARLPG
ncbi:GDSL lipase [Mycobacterium sp. 1274756.6]|uniref:Rv0518 family GDSL lipase n=1 Tax=Mycobacterium sp. 1274756.6 TaxID=1834076 RepID=UPI000ACF2632